jgi:hypothetical protein
MSATSQARQNSFLGQMPIYETFLQIKALANYSGPSLKFLFFGFEHFTLKILSMTKQ